jgi:Zn-dependent alcohol dehydrogenase
VQFVPYLMAAHAKGQFPLDRFVRYYDMKDYKQAIEDSKSGKTIKAVLRW